MSVLFCKHFLKDIATHGLEVAEGRAGGSAYSRTYETSALKEARGRRKSRWECLLKDLYETAALKEAVGDLA